jgi:hypothetical protein
MDLNTILENFASISTKVNENVFIVEARKSVNENLKKFSIDEEKQAELYATYETNLSIAIVTKLLDLSKELPILQAQESDIKEATSLKTEQKNLVKKQQNTEIRRQEDLAATILLKGQDTQYKYQQTLFEESRRYLGIKANSDNMAIRKAMAKVEEMAAFMSNESYNVGTSQIEDSKNAINDISISSLIYPTSVPQVPNLISPSTLTES